MGNKYPSAVTMILVDAIYICQSGGKNLLDLLIDRFENQVAGEDFKFLIDLRIKESYINKKFRRVKFEFLPGNEMARYKYYKKNKQAFQKVFCFANVPPPLRLRCHVITFFQNVLLFDRELHKYFPIKTRLLFRLKGYLIKQRLVKTNSWIVQTEHVKTLLVNKAGIKDDQIRVIPFFSDKKPKSTIRTETKENAFFYPAMGAAHKNHEGLLESWSGLFRKGILKYELHLTIDKDASRLLALKIDKLREEGIPVINHGYLPMGEVNSLYARCKFVIHPSFGESFALVLIEAIENGCILLAPDLPYVRAVVQPDYYFNAEKNGTIEKSIMQAVTEENHTDSKILIRNELETLMKYIIN